MFKDSAELHLGVVCSTCKKPIQGSRYKCLACHDYDLCHSCELIGTHLEHAMIKIPTPSTPWVAQIMASYLFIFLSFIFLLLKFCLFWFTFLCCNYFSLLAFPSFLFLISFFAFVLFALLCFSSLSSFTDLSFFSPQSISELLYLLVYKSRY